MVQSRGKEIRLYDTTLKLDTSGHTDILDITQEIQAFLTESRLSQGTVTLFIPGSTASLTTIEYEPGAVEDFKTAVERIVPKNIPYKHNERWGDGNGYSHIRAALLGPSLSVPFQNTTLILGTWQQIILVDFDNRPRTREIHVQIMGF